MTQRDIGHGLHPVDKCEAEAVRQSLETIREAILDEFTPASTFELEGAILRVAAEFRTVSERRDPRWFERSELLSHPSPRLAEAMSRNLRILLSALRADDIRGINRRLDVLESLHLLKIADAAGASATPQEDPARYEGWAYVLFSPSFKGAAAVGATAGTMRNQAAEMNEANLSQLPFGLHAAWRVTNPERASYVLERVLAGRSLENGFYRLMDDLDMADLVTTSEQALFDAKLVVGDPSWRSPSSKPFLERDIYTEVARGGFQSDVPTVFEAFRRI